MNEQELIKEICQKEIEYGCYEAKIDGLSIYSLIRRQVRARVLREYGGQIMQSKTKINRKEAILSVVISAFHLIKLLIIGSKKETLFLSFPRIDNINGLFLDKFTDPIIELCDFGDNYIILEHGLGGVHKKNRLHRKNLVYIDFVYLMSNFGGRLFGKRVYKKHYREFEKLNKTLSMAFGLTTNNAFYREYFMSLISIKIYSLLLRRLSVKRVAGPSRDYLKRILIAARKQDVKVYEMQHGITYGETLMYSGYRDEMFLPDYFLAFGDNKPLNVYGIDESRIVNIGWALNDYILGMKGQEQYKRNDVLVVSEPVITEAIISAVIKLAENNPDSTFYLRPHPHETLTNEQLEIISKIDNLKVQDKTINITVVLQSFNHIIGENSTVLYEALAVHKKVGRMFFEGLKPIYLEENDQECFWEIRNQQDFEIFLNEDISVKKSKSIYSPFNKDLLCKTLELK